jgi:hypothetical protein
MYIDLERFAQNVRLEFLGIKEECPFLEIAIIFKRKIVLLLFSIKSTHG